MSIGGFDVVLPFRWEAADRDRILRFVRHVWSEGIYEDARGPYAGTFSEALRFAPPSPEFFLYVSQEARAGWDAPGATPATDSTMLHVVGGDSITLVLDEPGALKTMVAELADVVARNRLTTIVKGRDAA